MCTNILTLNMGSSSLKFSLYGSFKQEKLKQIFYGQITSLDNKPVFIVKDSENKVLFEQHDFTNFNLTKAHSIALQIIFDWLNQNIGRDNIHAVGHRVVHGAHLFTNSVILTPIYIQQLEILQPLAPLHQTYTITAIKTIQKTNPNLLQIACFDTAFHYHQPENAQIFALPDNLSAIPIKRYGFHGLSYEYIVQVLPKYLGESHTSEKMIIAHLGNGASLCAIEQGKSMATTMGFSVLDGLPMSTRCGSLDPGVILFLLSYEKMNVSEISELLYRRSGLLGVSGISGDLNVLLSNPAIAAKKAVDLFVYRIVREIGSLIAALGGINSIIFTGGVGENIYQIREKICQSLTWLDAKLDKHNNQKNYHKISHEDSKLNLWVIPTNEELIIAQHTLTLLQNHQ